ncbi:GNAT family N-acetyltransferase [Polymorphobacter sp.]|uniref:GNAT family N-acetyltransferase n=1 Tax=Polymorphobacter sp. TaxID=1909290 RepID=UPI003F704027
MIGYRDATPADGAVLGGLARATFIETFGHLYRLEDLETFLGQGSDEAYAAELRNPGLEVRFALAGGVPIGFAKIGPLKLPAPTLRPAMELRQLYLFKPWQGQGIGEALLAWAIDRARAHGAAELWLSVYVDNPGARRFYARHGFVETGAYAFMVGAQADDERLCRLDLHPQESRT